MRQREWKVIKGYDLVFTYLDFSGGFAYPCDEKGNLLPIKNEISKESYRKCVAKEYPVGEPEVVCTTIRWVESDTDICE